MNVPLLLCFTLSPLFPPPSAAQVLPQALPQPVSGRDFPGAVSHLRLAWPGDCLWQGRARRDFQGWETETVVLLCEQTGSHYLDYIFESPSTPCCNDLVIKSKCAKAAVLLICCRSRINFPFFFMPFLQTTDSRNMEKWSLFSHLDQRKYMVRIIVPGLTCVRHHLVCVVSMFSLASIINGPSLSTILRVDSDASVLKSKVFSGNID